MSPHIHALLVLCLVHGGWNSVLVVLSLVSCVLGVACGVLCVGVVGLGIVERRGIRSFSL